MTAPCTVCAFHLGNLSAADLTGRSCWNCGASWDPASEVFRESELAVCPLCDGTGRSSRFLRELPCAKCGGGGRVGATREVQARLDAAFGRLLREARFTTP